MVDEWTHEALAIDVGGSIRSTRVIEVLDRLVAERGAPQTLRLDMHWFSSRAEARVRIEPCRREYNEVRPHSSIAYLTPATFVRQNRSTPNPGRGEAALY